MTKQPDIYVAFYKAPGNWFDRLIRLITRAKYTHCEVAITDPFTQSRNVYLCFSASIRDGGARIKRMPLNPNHWDVVAVDSVKEQPLNTEIIRERFERTRGARYDYWGVFRFLLPMLVRQVPDKWFCSELCAMLLDMPKPHQYTPQDLYNTLKDNSHG